MEMLSELVGTKDADTMVATIMVRNLTAFDYEQVAKIAMTLIQMPLRSRSVDVVDYISHSSYRWVPLNAPPDPTTFKDRGGCLKECSQRTLDEWGE